MRTLNKTLYKGKNLLIYKIIVYYNTILYNQSKKKIVMKRARKREGIWSERIIKRDYRLLFFMRSYYKWYGGIFRVREKGGRGKEDTKVTAIKINKRLPKMLEVPPVSSGLPMVLVVLPPELGFSLASEVPSERPEPPRCAPS